VLKGAQVALLVLEGVALGGVDLGGVDLGGVDLGGVDLGGVDLGGVDLGGVLADLCVGLSGFKVAFFVFGFPLVIGDELPG
jgi:uncharacterized protein YjbI with pentapeptide repeats